MSNRIWRTALLVLSGLLHHLTAQVSPGPLSKAHESLDNPLKCASCHVFGAGAPKLKCLYCHTEIQALVANRGGMHGRVVNAAKRDMDCVRCHTEHYGRDFRILKWETSRDEFDHRQTGYPLEGKHSKVRCEQCHNPAHIAPSERSRIKVKNLSQTFEGLHTACTGCHADRHAGQLGTSCEKCHSVEGWKPVTPFDHSKTKFALTGKHRDTPCAKCHKPTAADAKVIQYKGLSFAACTPCHQDPHRGAFTGKCENCHDTEQWKRVRTMTGFDHGATKFPLAGKHRDTPCMKCHKDANFKTPLAHEKCLDCHKDQHQGQFAKRKDGGDCASCHTAADWRPSTFTESSHQAAAYPLEGKHRGLACAKCHTPAKLDTDYHPRFQRCSDCHRDPHDSQFAQAPHANRCEDCHTVGAFVPATYTLKQHQSSRFALKDAHMAVACGSCHQPKKTGGPDLPGVNPHAGWKFTFPDTSCAGCHADPHRGDFPPAMKAAAPRPGDECEGCHNSVRWQQVKSFDHGQTDFPITGAHQALRCLSCHRPVQSNGAAREIPFRGAPRRCDGCHEDIHGGQFQSGQMDGDCSRCHTTGRWVPAAFDHEKDSTFSLRGAHEKVPCRLCHVARPGPGGRSLAIYKNTTRECSACHASNSIPAARGPG